MLAKQGRASPNRAEARCEVDMGWKVPDREIRKGKYPTSLAVGMANDTGPIDEAGWKSAERKGGQGSSKAGEMAQDSGPINGERGWTGDCRSEQNPQRINRATTTRDDTGPIDGEWGWFTQCLPEHNSRSHNPATTSRDQTGPIDGEHGWNHGCWSKTPGSSNATTTMGDGGPIDGEHGWNHGFIGDGRASNYAQYTINFPHLLQVAQRLQGVTIDNRDAIKIIERYDRTYAFLYLDPPYMLSTRRGNLYKYEMSDEQHVTLLEAALAYTGKVAISGYANDLYDTMLADWQRIEIPTKLSIVINTEGKKNDRMEILWTNYRKQPALF